MCFRAVVLEVYTRQSQEKVKNNKKNKTRTVIQSSLTNRVTKGQTEKGEKTLLNHASSPSEVTLSLLLTGNRKFTFVWNL